MRTVWLALLAAVPLLVLAELYVEVRRLRPQVFLLRPLATTGMLAIALASPAPVSAWYQAAVAVGLLCSLAGDVFLMLPRDRFLAGLASFLAAQVCYILAFGSAGGMAVAPLALAVLAAYGGYLLHRLWPRLGKYRPAVAGYALVILVMVGAAHQQLMRAGGLRPALALAGAVLFVSSDSVLALDRFEAGWKRRQLLVLSTYYSAQWLIAASVSDF